MKPVQQACCIPFAAPHTLYGLCQLFFGQAQDGWESKLRAIGIPTPFGLSLSKPCQPRRLGRVLGLLLLLALWLAGCGTPAPPPALYQLRSTPPVAVQAVQAVPGAVPVLQLLLPVAIPELLERDAIVVATGQAGVQALAGHRWAEPLRDAVPRLLRQDLAALLGNGQVWVAPLPAGLAVQKLLRVELLQLQADATRTSVQLQARWTLSDAASPAAAAAPVLTQVEMLSVPITGADTDALVVAHRLALWRLAERLSQAVLRQR